MTAFSPEAQQRWDQIPDSAKQTVLANVWCAQCRKGVSIVNLAGSVEGDSLILRGICASCGHAVARVLEGQ